MSLIIPDFILNLEPAQQGLLKNAFDHSGKSRVIPKIIAFFLNKDKPIRKSEIIANGFLKDNESKGYYSIYFSVLAKAKIIQYNTSTQSLERGANFTAYLEYIILSLLFGLRNKALILFTKSQAERLDKNMNEVVAEVVREQDGLRSLRILITGNKDQGQDFILNL